MSEKASKTIIGAFVLGALALLLIAVTVISSGRMFSKPMRFVMIFESSLKGLSPGSPVVFRGVPIGRVSAIRMSGDMDTMRFLTPVYVEIDQGVMDNLKDSLDTPDDGSAPYLHKMVESGLRARLNNQSLLTGQLLIELDFFEEHAPQLTPGNAPLTFYDSLPVIPTIPSQFDAIWQRLARLPLEQVGRELLSIMSKVDKLLADPSVHSLAGNLDATVTDIRTAFKSLDATMQSFKNLAEPLQSIASSVDKQTPETLERVRRLVDTYTKLATQFEASLESMRGVVGPNTVTILELNRTIRELGETARSVRGLAGTLERNPESLLIGKGGDRK